VKFALRCGLAACVVISLLNIYVFLGSEQSSFAKLFLPLSFSLYCAYYFYCRLSARNAHLGIGIVTRADTARLVFNDLIALALPLIFLVGHVAVRQ
jgi:hypothetical protein